MVALTDIDNKIKICAGLVGLVQAAAWIPMSIICIVFYHSDYIPEFSDTSSYMSNINRLMYYFVLNRENDGFPGQKLRPAVFNGFMYAYVILSIIWMLISGTVMSKRYNTLGNVLKAWSLVTALICLFDFIFVILLGTDYNECLGLYDVQAILIEQNCANGILPVLVIGARGFILWIINVLFAIVLVRMAPNVKKRTQPPPTRVTQSQLEQYDFQQNGLPSPHPRYQAHVQSNDYFPYEQYPQSPIPTSPAPPSANIYGRMQAPFQPSQYQHPIVLADPPRRFRS